MWLQNLVYNRVGHALWSYALKRLPEITFNEWYDITDTLRYSLYCMSHKWVEILLNSAVCYKTFSQGIAKLTASCSEESLCIKELGSSDRNPIIEPYTLFCGLDLIKRDYSSSCCTKVTTWFIACTQCSCYEVFQDEEMSIHL